MPKIDVDIQPWLEIEQTAVTGRYLVNASRGDTHIRVMCKQTQRIVDWEIDREIDHPSNYPEIARLLLGLAAIPARRLPPTHEDRDGYTIAG
jgi:hypothetical protein